MATNPMSWSDEAVMFMQTMNMLNHNFACKPMQMPFDIKKVTKLNLEGFATETAKS